MWEICAVRSVPRMSPFLCFVLFFREKHLLIPKYQRLAHLYRHKKNSTSAYVSAWLDCHFLICLVNRFLGISEMAHYFLGSH